MVLVLIGFNIAEYTIRQAKKKKNPNPNLPTLSQVLINLKKKKSFFKQNCDRKPIREPAGPRDDQGKKKKFLKKLRKNNVVAQNLIFSPFLLCSP